MGGNYGYYSTYAGWGLYISLDNSIESPTGISGDVFVDLGPRSFGNVDSELRFTYEPTCSISFIVFSAKMDTIM